MKWVWSDTEAPAYNIKLQVGEGWGDILERLVTDLLKLGWDGDLYQVKEKFGGLRFYIGGASDEVHERIRKAEEESYHTCEFCGAAAKAQNIGYWIKTVCDTCKERKDGQ